MSEVNPHKQWWIVRGLAKRSMEEAEKERKAGTKENIV